MLKIKWLTQPNRQIINSTISVITKKNECLERQFIPSLQKGIFYILSTFFILSILNSNFVSAATASNPMGGWRYTPSGESHYKQKVNYPASQINDGDYDLKNLIYGEIKNHPKKQPAQMIVNGASMPLSVQENGSYRRPYAFGSGSNSVEVRSNGQKVSRRQFYEANSGKTPVKLRIILAWDTDHTDVDLHVITPKGEHAWYGQRVIPSGGAIDIDATDGYGPEIFATPNPERGLYKVYANYFGGANGDKVITLAKLTLITNENTIHEKQQTFNIPLRKAGEIIKVKDFYY